MEVDDLRTQRGASIERGESFEVEEHQRVNISRLLGGKPRGVYQTAISGFHTTFSASVLEDEDEGDDGNDQSEAVADRLWDINKSISDEDLRLGIDDQQVSDNREDDRFQTSRWSDTSDAFLDNRQKENLCGTNNSIPFDQYSRNEAWFGEKNVNGFGQSSKNDDWFKEKDGHVSWSHAYDYETSVRESERDSWLSWKTEHSKDGDNNPVESPSDISGEFYLPFDPDSLGAASDSIAAKTGVFRISGKEVSVERGESFEISKSTKIRSQVLKEAGDMSLFQVTFDGCAAEQRSSDDTVEWGDDFSGLRGNVASGSDDTVQTKNECDDTTQNRETALWDVRWRNGELVQEVEDSSVLESESLTRLVMLEHTDLLSTTSEDLTHPDDFAVQGQALEAYLEKTPNPFGSDVQGRANPDYEWKEEEDNPENSDEVLTSNDISITKELEADEGMFPFLETSSKTFSSLSSLERMESFDTSPTKTFKYQDKHYFHVGVGGFQTSFHDPFLDDENPDANRKVRNISEDSNLESKRDDSSDMFLNETVACNAEEASKLSKAEMGYNSVEEETTMEEEREHLSRTDQASADDYSDAQEENKTIEDGTVDDMMSLSVPYTRLENFEDGSVSRNFLEFETDVPTQEGIGPLGCSFEFLDLSLQKSVVDKYIDFVQEQREETEDHSEDEEIQSMEHSEADDETGEEETKDFLHRHEQVPPRYSVERMESFEVTTPGLIRSSKIEGFNAAGGGFHTSFHSLMSDNQEEDAHGSPVDLLANLDSQATSSYRDVLSDERTTNEDRETNINDSDGFPSTKDIQGNAETVEVSFRPPSSLTHSNGIFNGDEVSVARQADADLLFLTLSSPTQTFSSSVAVPTKLEPEEDMLPFLETDSKTLSSLPSLERAESFDTSPSRTLKYQTNHYFHVGAGGFQTSFHDPFLDGDNPDTSKQLGDIEAKIVDKDDLVPAQDFHVVAETAETTYQSPSISAPLYPQGTLPSDDFDGLSSADSKQHRNPFLLTDSSDSFFRPAQTESEQENSVPSNELLIQAKKQSKTEEIHHTFSSPVRALAHSVATHAELEATWSTSTNEELFVLEDRSQHFAQEAQEADTTDNPSNEMINDSLQPLQYSLGKEDRDYFGSIGHAYMELRKDISVAPKPNTNPFLEDYDVNAVNFDDSVGKKTSDAFITTNELEDRTFKHETHEGEKTVDYLLSTEEIGSMITEAKTIQDSFSGKPSSLDLRRSVFKNKGHLRGAPTDDFLQRDSDQTQLHEANSLTQNLSRTNPFREDADLHVLAEADTESTYESYGYPLDESPVKDNIYEGFYNTKSHPDFFPGEKAKSPHDFENTAGCSEDENIAFASCRKLTFEERLSLEKDDAQTDNILVSHLLITPENVTGGLSDNISSSPLNPCSDDGVDDGFDSNDVAADHTSDDDANSMSDEDAVKDGDVTGVKQNRSSRSETQAHTDLPVEEDVASSSTRREVLFAGSTSMDQQRLSRDSQTVSEMTRRYSMDSSPSSPFECTFKTSAALKEVEYNYRQWSQDIQQEALPESRHMDGTDFISSAWQYPDNTAGKDGYSSPKDNTRQPRASFAESSEATDDFDDDSLDEKDATESDYLSEDSKSLEATARGWGGNAKALSDNITEYEDTLIYSSVSKDQQKYVSTDDDYSFFENEREAGRTELVSSKPGLQENIDENPFFASAEFVQEDVPVQTGTTHPDGSFQPSDTISTFKQTHQNEPFPHEFPLESEVHDDELEFREAVMERFEAQEALNEHLFLSPQTRFEHETSSWTGIGSSFAPLVQQDLGSFSVSMSSCAEHASTTDTGVIGEDTHEERSSRDEPEHADTCDNKFPRQSTAVTAEVKLDASNTFSEAAYMQFTHKLESLTAERIFDNKATNENGEVQVAGLSAELPLVVNVPPNSAADSVADSEASGPARDEDDGNERGYDEDDVFVTSTDVHGYASSEDRRMSSLSHSSRSTSTSGSHSGSRRSSSDTCHAEAWLPEGDTVTSELLLAVRQGSLENARAVVEEGTDGFVPTEERVRSRAHVRARPEILSSTSWSTSEQEDDEQPQTHAPRRRYSLGAELEAAMNTDLWRAYEADDDATCSERDVPRIAGKRVQTPLENEDSLSHENYALSRHQPENVSGATDDDINLLSRSLVFHRSRSTTDDFPVVEDSVEESTVLVNFYSPAHKSVTISEDTHQSIEEHLLVLSPALDEPKSVHGLRHSHEGEDLAEEDDHIFSNTSECEDLTNNVEKEETIGSFENHDFEAFVLHRTQEVTAYEEKGDAASAAETWSTESGAQQTDNFSRAFEESEFYEAKMATEKERSILLKENNRERPWSSVDDDNDLAFLEAGHDERRSPNNFVRSSERNPSDSTSTSSRQTLSTTGTGSIDELRGSLGQLDIQDLSIFTESESRVWSEQRSPTLELQVGLKADDAGQHLEDSFDIMDQAELMHVNETFAEPPPTIADNQGLVTSEARITLKAGRREPSVGRYGNLRKTHEESFGGTFGSIEGASFSQSTDSFTLVAFEKLAAAEIESAAERGFASLNDSGCPSISSLDLSPPRHMSGDEPGSKSLSFADDITYQREQTTDEVFYLYDQQEKKDGGDGLEPAQSDELAEQEKTLGGNNIFTEEKLPGDRKPTWMEKAINKARDVYSSVEQKLRRRKTRSRAQHPSGGLDDTKGEADLDYSSGSEEVDSDDDNEDTNPGDEDKWAWPSDGHEQTVRPIHEAAFDEGAGDADKPELLQAHKVTARPQLQRVPSITSESEANLFTGDSRDEECPDYKVTCLNDASPDSAAEIPADLEDRSKGKECNNIFDQLKSEAISVSDIRGMGEEQAVKNGWDEKYTPSKQSGLEPGIELEVSSSQLIEETAYLISYTSECKEGEPQDVTPAIPAAPAKKEDDINNFGALLVTNSLHQAVRELVVAGKDFFTESRLSTVAHEEDKEETIEDELIGVLEADTDERLVFEDEMACVHETVTEYEPFVDEDSVTKSNVEKQTFEKDEPVWEEDRVVMKLEQVVKKDTFIKDEQTVKENVVIKYQKDVEEENVNEDESLIEEDVTAENNTVIEKKIDTDNESVSEEENVAGEDELVTTEEPADIHKQETEEEHVAQDEVDSENEPVVEESLIPIQRNLHNSSLREKEVKTNDFAEKLDSGARLEPKSFEITKDEQIPSSLQKEHFRGSSHSSIDSDYEKYFPFTDSEISNTAFSYTAVASAELSACDVRYENDLVVEKETAESGDDSIPAGYLLPENDDSSAQAGFTLPHSPKIPETEALSEPFTPDYVKYAEIRQEEETRSTSTNSSDDEIVLSEKSPRLLLQTTIQNKDFTSLENDNAFVSSEQPELILQRKDEIIEQRLSSELQCGTTYLGQEVFQTLTQSQDNSTEDEILDLNDESDSRLQASSASETENQILDNRCQSRLSLYKDDLCQNDASFEAGENVQDEDTNDTVALTKSFRGDEEIRAEWLPPGYVQENSEALRSLQLEISYPVWQGDVNEAESRDFFTSTPRTDTVSFTPEKFYYTSRETVQDRQAQEHFDLSEYPDVDVKVDERPTELQEQGDIKDTRDDEDARTERSVHYHGSGRQDESYSEEVGAERLVQHDGHDKEVPSAAQNEEKSGSSLLLEESTQSRDSENEEEVAERSFMNDERQAQNSVENEEGWIQISEKSPATDYLSEPVEFIGENDVLTRKRPSFETSADLLPADSYENSLGGAQWESFPDTNDDQIDDAEIQPLPRPLHRYDSSADDGLSSVDEEPEDNLSEDSTYEKEEPSQANEWSVRRYSEEDAALGKISGDAEDTSRDTEIQSRDFCHDHDEENETFMLAVSTDLETKPSVREDHDTKVEIEARVASFNQRNATSVGRQWEVDYDEECEEEAMQKQTAVSELSAKHEDEAYERGEVQADEETKYSEQKRLLDVGEVTPIWFHVKDTFATAFDWENQGLTASNTFADPNDPDAENLKAIPESLQRQELESSVSGISDDENELAAGSKQHAESDKEREDIGKEDTVVSHENEFTAAVSFSEEASAPTVEGQDQESKVPETWVAAKRSDVASDADGIQSTTPETEEEMVKSFRNVTYLTRTHSAEEPRHDELVSMPAPDNRSPGDVTSRPAIDDETYDEVTNIPTVKDQSSFDDLSHKDNIAEDSESFTHGQQVTECRPNITEDLQSGDITRVPGIAEAGRSDDVTSTENGDESELFASTKRIGDRLTSFTKMFKIAFSEERQSTDIPEVSDTLSKEQMPLEQTANFLSSESIEKTLEFDEHGMQADRDVSSEALSLNLRDQVAQEYNNQLSEYVRANKDNSTAIEEEVDVKENADIDEPLYFSGNLENYATYLKEYVSIATQETQDEFSSNAESRSLMQEDGAEERRNSFDAAAFTGYVDSEDTLPKKDVFPASKDLQNADMVTSLPQDVSQKTPKDETFVSEIAVDYQEGNFSDTQVSLGRDEFSTRQPVDDVMIYQTDTLENTYSSDQETRLFPTEDEMHVTEREPFEENLYIIRDKQSGGAQDSVSREMVLGDLLEEKLLLKQEKKIFDEDEGLSSEGPLQDPCNSSRRDDIVLDNDDSTDSGPEDDTVELRQSKMSSTHQAIERAFEFAKDEDSSFKAYEKRGMEEDSPWQTQSDSDSQIVTEGLSLTSVQEHTEVSVKAFAVQVEVQPPVWKNEASQSTSESSLVYQDESETNSVDLEKEHGDIDDDYEGITKRTEDLTSADNQRYDHELAEEPSLPDKTELVETSDSEEGQQEEVDSEVDDELDEESDQQLKDSEQEEIASRYEWLLKGSPSRAERIEHNFMFPEHSTESVSYSTTQEVKETFFVQQQSASLEAERTEEKSYTSFTALESLMGNDTDERFDDKSERTVDYNSSLELETLSHNLPCSNERTFLNERSEMVLSVAEEKHSTENMQRQASLNNDSALSEQAVTLVSSERRDFAPVTNSEQFRVEREMHSQELAHSWERLHSQELPLLVKREYSGGENVLQFMDSRDDTRYEEHLSFRTKIEEGVPDVEASAPATVLIPTTPSFADDEQDSDEDLDRHITKGDLYLQNDEVPERTYLCQNPDKIDNKGDAWDSEMQADHLSADLHTENMEKLMQEASIPQILDDRPEWAVSKKTDFMSLDSLGCVEGEEKHTEGDVDDLSVDDIQYKDREEHTGDGIVDDEDVHLGRGGPAEDEMGDLTDDQQDDEDECFVASRAVESESAITFYPWSQELTMVQKTSSEPASVSLAAELLSASSQSPLCFSPEADNESRTRISGQDKLELRESGLETDHSTRSDLQRTQDFRDSSSRVSMASSSVDSAAWSSELRENVLSFSSDSVLPSHKMTFLETRLGDDVCEENHTQLIEELVLKDYHQSTEKQNIYEEEIVPVRATKREMSRTVEDQSLFPEEGWESEVSYKPSRSPSCLSQSSSISQDSSEDSEVHHRNESSSNQTYQQERKKSVDEEEIISVKHPSRETNHAAGDNEPVSRTERTECELKVSEDLNGSPVSLPISVAFEVSSSSIKSPYITESFPVSQSPSNEPSLFRQEAGVRQATSKSSEAYQRLSSSSLDESLTLSVSRMNAQLHDHGDLSPSQTVSLPLVDAGASSESVVRFAAADQTVLFRLSAAAGSAQGTIWATTSSHASPALRNDRQLSDDGSSWEKFDQDHKPLIGGEAVNEDPALLDQENLDPNSMPFELFKKKNKTKKAKEKEAEVAENEVTDIIAEPVTSAESQETSVLVEENIANQTSSSDDVGLTEVGEMTMKEVKSEQLYNETFELTEPKLETENLIQETSLEDSPAVLPTDDITDHVTPMEEGPQLSGEDAINAQPNKLEDVGVDGKGRERESLLRDHNPEGLVCCTIL